MDRFKKNGSDPLDTIITSIEKAMVRKPLVSDVEIADEYIAGYIDALHEFKVVTEIQRDFLHLMFAQQIF